MFDDPTALRKDLAAHCQGFEAVGLDLADLIEAAELPGRPEDLTDAQLIQVAETAHIALWTRAGLLDPAPDLALRVGAAVPWGAYDVIDYLAATCEDLSTGMVALSRYFGLITTSLSLSTAPEGARRGLTVTLHSPQAVLGLLYTFGVTITHFRETSQDGLRALGVDLMMPKPDDPEPFETFFGGPVQFSMLRNTVWLSPETWSAPSKRAEPALHTLVKRHATEAVQNRGIGASLVERLRPLIVEALAKGQADLPSVAPQVGCSPRTLQRRLADAGTAFSDEVDAARQSLAARYLAEARLSIAEVAWLLGYSEASAFVRACERWTGLSPGRYRARLRSNGEAPAHLR